MRENIWMKTFNTVHNQNKTLHVLLTMESKEILLLFQNYSWER